MRVPLPLSACGNNSVNDDDLPAFLRVENREPLTPEQQAALDKAMAVARASQRARDDVRALQRETKREKSRIRIEKLIAKKNGDTTRMPPTGKAAIALIKATSAAAPPAGRQNNSISSNRTKTARGTWPTAEREGASVLKSPKPQCVANTENSKWNTGRMETGQGSAASAERLWPSCSGAKPHRSVR
jgi:hypothetical protein